MTNRHEVLSPKSMLVGALLLLAACSNGASGGGEGGATAVGGRGGQSSGGGATSGGSSGSGGVAGLGGSSASGGTAGGGRGGTASSGGTMASGGQTGGTGGRTSGTGGQAGAGQSGGTVAGTGGRQTGGTASAGTGGSGAGGRSGGASGQGGNTATAGRTGSPGVDGGLTSACVGKAWPTADPTSAPFEVVAEKKVGPLAGYTPDPIYGDEQQRFNIYRPKNLADGYCHPILVWSNGHTDNPEPNPPKCVVDSGANKWCGQYLPVVNHLAAHGFVVIASLSTTTSKGDPLPSIVGLDWLLKQAEDPANTTYYHRLDTARIGALGHSEGGMATCMMAKDPRFSVIATVSGTSTITALHGPALFFCGGKEGDNGSVCNNIQKVASGITDQPSMLINNLNADHGSWAYEGAKGVDIPGLAAWFRIHLMDDTANRKRFYGENCTFCTDSRVKVYRNSLMNQ